MGWLMAAVLLFLYYQVKGPKGLGEGELGMIEDLNSHLTSFWLS